VGLAIAAMNAGAAREVWEAAREEPFGGCLSDYVEGPF